MIDCKCLGLTVVAMLRHDGVVEGGTGAMAKEEKETSKGPVGK